MRELNHSSISTARNNMKYEKRIIQKGKATHCPQKGEDPVRTEAIGALNTSKSAAKIPGVSSEPLPMLVPVVWQLFLFQTLLYRKSCVSAISKTHVRSLSSLSYIQRGTFDFFFFYYPWKLMVRQQWQNDWSS